MSQELSQAVARPERPVAIHERDTTFDAIRLEASSFCQLRCPACPTTDGLIRPAVGSGFLTYGNFVKLADANPGVTSIELSNWGEVFLNPDILRIFEYAYGRKVRLTIGNGANLNTVRDNVLEGLVKYGVANINCSIDGASPETYKIYRRKGNFDTVIKNIARINEFKEKYNSALPKLVWQFVIFGHNEHEIEAARSMAERLGMTFRTKLAWDDSFSPVRDKDMVRRVTAGGSATRPEYEETHGKAFNHKLCHQLWNRLQINWDGKILGCVQNHWGDFGNHEFGTPLEESSRSEKLTYAKGMLTGHLPPRADIPCSTCSVYITGAKHGAFITSVD